MDPALFGEDPLPGLQEVIPDRDQMEIELVMRLLDMDKPILQFARAIRFLILLQEVTFIKTCTRSEMVYCSIINMPLVTMPLT
ncbi:hypothetical protein GCM10011571_06700 [Marinithermofilum abyssi]|uniref:Uncharacterized protein n=1 Tax=Marinithermofilum abyssi TaxID=1571185 RepID=A0A8J2VDD2_9BACL|nr:hypothetical protein GCM10011571_06700 [Marinithermofilum abyssi]